jgi:hypothetical protein
MKLSAEQSLLMLKPLTWKEKSKRCSESQSWSRLTLKNLKDSESIRSNEKLLSLTVKRNASAKKRSVSRNLTGRCRRNVIS